MALWWVNMDRILLIIPSMMINYGNNVPEMIRKVECLGGVQCLILYPMTGTPSTRRCTRAPSSGSKDVQNYLDSIRGELKEEMIVELKEEMKNELKEEISEELKEEMCEELTEEMHAEIQDMLVEHGIKSTRQPITKQGNASGCTS